jgi:hypothetical protein
MTPLLVNGRRLRVGLLVPLVAAVLVLGPVSSMATAATKTCGVRNTTLGKSYRASAGTGLQVAIDAARPGDTIAVRGRCVGNYSIGTSLTLVGRATSSYPTATLDGGRTGTVVRVTGADVTLDGLLITNGSAGGVTNSAGTVRVIGGTISGNTTAGSGGGISTGLGGSVTLTGSSVSGNTAVNGGGIAAGFGTVTLSGSSVSGNTASANGGGISNSGGTVSLLNSQVSGNNASPTLGSGGGIFNDTSTLIVGIITLDTGSSVSGNSPDDCVGCVGI